MTNTLKRIINPNYLDKPYRRHKKTCGSKDPQELRCTCPIYAQGRLKGEYVRIPTGKRSMQEALTWCDQKVAWAKNPDLNPDPDTPPEGIHAVKNDKALAEAVQIFVEKAATKGSRTEKNYVYTAKHFQCYAEKKGVVALKDVAPEYIESYFADHEKEWPSEATKQSKLTYLKCFFNYCSRDMHWIPYSPIPRGMNFDAKSTREPLEPEEITRILEAIKLLPVQKQAKARALLLLLIASGVRICDATFMERTYIDARGLLEHYMIKGNKQLETKIRLRGCVLEALQALPESRVYFFVPDREDDYREAREILRTPRKKNSSSKKKRFDEAIGLALYERAIRENTNLVEEVMILAGVRKPASQKYGKNATAEDRKDAKGICHRFRDTFAVTMIMAGKGLVTVSRMLGHHDVKITDKHYAKFFKKYADMMAEETGAIDSLFEETSALNGLLPAA